jgi:hypothetical protein
MKFMFSSPEKARHLTCTSNTIKKSITLSFATFYATAMILLHNSSK